MIRYALLLALALTLAPPAGAQTAPGSPEERQLVIRTYSGQTPMETISIPLTTLQIAAKFVPESVLRDIEAEGFSVEQILEATRDPEVRGTLAKIEDHKVNQTTVLTIE